MQTYTKQYQFFQTIFSKYMVTHISYIHCTTNFVRTRNVHYIFRPKTRQSWVKCIRQSFFSPNLHRLVGKFQNGQMKTVTVPSENRGQATQVLAKSKVSDSPATISYENGGMFFFLGGGGASLDSVCCVIYKRALLQPA